MFVRTPCEFCVLVVSIRSPYDLCSQIIIKNRAAAGYPYGARTCLLRATVLQFLKICKSADYYEIVEATEIV